MKSIAAIALALTTALAASALAAPAFAEDTPAAPAIAFGFGAGAFCGLKPNFDAGAAYLRGAIKGKEVDTYIMVVAMAATAGIVKAEAEQFNKSGVNCDAILDMYGPGGSVVPGLLEKR